MNIRGFASILAQYFRLAQGGWASNGRVVAVLAVLITALAIPSTAFARAETAWLRGLSASAGFSLVDPNDPCIQATLYVSAAETLTKEQPGKPVAEPGMGVFYQRTNTCTGEFLTGVFAGVLLPAEAFQIDKQLRTATLNASANVCDMFGGTDCVSVDVHLTWTGTGEIARNKEFIFSDDGQCKFHYRYRGSTRPAEVSGSLTADGLEFSTGTQFNAQLGSAKEGTTGIDCPF